MELTLIEETDDRIDLALTGRLDASGVDKIDSRFLGWFNHLDKPVTLDFSGVTYLSSLGIRLLLNGWKMANRQGVKMHVKNPLPEISDVLTMSGLGELVA